MGPEPTHFTSALIPDAIAWINVSFSAIKEHKNCVVFLQTLNCSFVFSLI